MITEMRATAVTRFASGHRSPGLALWRLRLFEHRCYSDRELRKRVMFEDRVGRERPPGSVGVEGPALRIDDEDERCAACEIYSNFFFNVGAPIIRRENLDRGVGRHVGNLCSLILVVAESLIREKGHVGHWRGSE